MVNKYRKMYPASMTIMKVQSEVTLGVHAPARMAFIKNIHSPNFGSDTGKRHTSALLVEM